MVGSRTRSPSAPALHRLRTPTDLLPPGARTLPPAYVVLPRHPSPARLHQTHKCTLRALTALYFCFPFITIT